MDYFIADPHFGHANIIKYCHRPFASTYEMDTRIVALWNSTVGNDDTVYLLGDIWDVNMLKNLSGRIIVVLGNHDRSDNLEHKIAKYVDYVSRYPIFINGLWLSHEPIEFMPPECPYLNIHGHIHNQVYGIPGTWNDGRRHFCCCVEQTGYKPISIQQIKDLICYEEKHIEYVGACK